ncbi:MAG TPA: diguanylate cyclase, partial [Candidatus Cybelea sp.]|nr:diguanylate cyclase [Candidatus Cybelea sp.]
MSAATRDTLLDQTTQTLASGRPLRELIPELFQRLVASYRGDAAALVLQSSSGYRVAYSSEPHDSALAGALEAAAAGALSGDVTGGDIATAPMRFGSAIIGAVALATAHPLDADDRRLLGTWAAILSLSLHQLSVEEENARLEAIAGNDQLTGISNRRSLDLRLRSDFERAQASQTLLSLAIFDIDYFKSYNDRYGHLAGDGALRRVAQAFAACLHRTGDSIARFGGEEFVAILPATDSQEAVTIAERMRAAVFDLRIPNEESGLGILTVSAGIATSRSQDGDSSDVLARADAELYRAKAAGRNHVAASDYLSQSVPASHAGAGVHNVPGSRTAFIGREIELANLQRAIERSRFVTLAGPGGAGKTRLAVQTALSVSGTYRDGVWFVDVSSLRDAPAILRQLAAHLGIQSRGIEVADAVADRLRHAHALIVFDGCERSLDGVRHAVDTLLARSIWPKIVCVSREVLNLPGESVLRLLGMRPSEAHELFARLTQSPVQRETERERELVESVCKQIDYLPLGIELFAAQASSLTLARLEMLVAHRMIPLRNLDEVIGWSVSLLDDRRRAIFCSLCIFSGGFSRQAAAAVAQAEAPDLEAFENKSLIVAHAGGELARYGLLDTMQEFARRAIDGRTLDMLRLRHYEYYRSLAASGTRDRLEPEGDNLAAALTFARSYASSSDMLSMTNSLVQFWLRSGRLAEGLYWLRQALERASEAPDADVALANRNAARISRLLSDYESARDYNERALEIWRSTGHFEGVASALNGLALVAHTTGEFDRAQILYEESLKQYDRLGDRLGVAMAVNNLGGLAMFRGDFDEAAR